MAESSISVAVRIRPFSAKEAAQLAPQDTAVPFLGDGGLGASPAKLPGAAPTLSSLRTKFLRPIIQPVDERVLIFDPPDTNPLSRLYSTASSASASSASGPPSNHFGHGSRRNRDVRYAFDRVFDEHCGQDVVFENTTKPLLDGILNGFNATVFAYGATGCGKTHTISGTPEDPGVIFLTMKELYQRIDDCREDSEVAVRLSYLEIYNETIRDLLSPEPTPPGQGLLLREDAANKISVMGITEHVPESPESVLRMIQEGNERRTMSPTEANAVSSRSHAVLQINVTQRPRAGGIVDETTSASLNIIDLAGSERASATRNNGARMKEGANINKSLLALGNCINALCSTAGQKGKHVPYRNSKLTRLLKFSLGGNCKTVMIVCVSPSSAHYEETHNTLKYANQAKNIRTKVSRNMLNVDRHVGQYVQTIHELNEQLKELKAQLAEQRSCETAAERRRKAEIAREVGEAKTNMRSSTESVKAKIEEHGAAEAVIEAAKARSAPLEARLEEIKSELVALAAQGIAPPQDLVSERDMLQHLVSVESSVISDPTLRKSVDHLDNCLQMQRGVVFAAAHNNKFDEAAAEQIRAFGAALMAEVEACRAGRKVEMMRRAMEEGAVGMARLVMVANRCTVAMREAADEMEWRAAETSEENKENADGIVDLASRLRGVSDANDGVLSSAFGRATTSASKSSASGRAKGSSASRSSALRKPRSSLLPSGAAAQAVVAPPSRSGAASASRSTRRLSVATTSLSRNVASPKGKTSLRTGLGAPMGGKAHAFMSPRAARRTSLGGAGARRKSVALLAGGSKAGRGLSAKEKPTTTTTAKKSFRWADEAGEGAIDDAGLAGAATIPSLVDESMQEAPSSEVDTELTPLSVPSKALRVPVTLQTSEEEGSEADSSSGGNTEWEDLAASTSTATGPPIARSTVADRVRGRDSLSRGGGAPKIGSIGGRRSVVTAALVPSKAGGGGLFERNRLAPGAQRRGEVESDMSSSLLSVSRGAVGPSSSPTPAKGDATALVPSKPASRSVSSSSSASTNPLAPASAINDENEHPPSRPAPYSKGQRDSGIGPVRRRGRSSLADSTNEVGPGRVVFPSSGPSAAPAATAGATTGVAAGKKLSLGAGAPNPFERGAGVGTTAPSPKTTAGAPSLPPVSGTGHIGAMRVSLRSSTTAGGGGGGPPVSNAAFVAAQAAAGQTSPRKASASSTGLRNSTSTSVAGGARRTSSFSTRPGSALGLVAGEEANGGAGRAQAQAVWR